MVIPQSTAMVPPSDGRPESDHNSLERDNHDSNDDCDDDSPADYALLRESQRDEAEERDNDDSNDDYDDESPPDPDNAERYRGANSCQLMN
jgi:hypothetical protein